MKRGSIEHPKTIHLAQIFRRLAVDLQDPGLEMWAEHIALSVLERLFGHWAPRYAIQGNIGRWPDAIIAHGVGWPHPPSTLLSALEEAGFLDRDADGKYVIHGIAEHADNQWRQSLEDRGLNWWDGSSPRKWSAARKSPRPNARMPRAKRSTATPAVADGPTAADLLAAFAPHLGRPDEAITARCLDAAGGGVDGLEASLRRIRDRCSGARSWGWFPLVLASISSSGLPPEPRKSVSVEGWITPRDAGLI